MTKSVKITKTIKIPAFLPLKYSKNIRSLFESTSVNAVYRGRCIIQHVLLSALLPFVLVFQQKKRYIWENPIFFDKSFAFFAPNFQTAGCALRRKVHFVSSFILRIFIPIYLSSRKKSFFVSSEMPVPVLFLCSPVLYPGLL